MMMNPKVLMASSAALSPVIKREPNTKYSIIPIKRFKKKMLIYLDNKKSPFFKYFFRLFPISLPNTSVKVYGF